MNKFTQSIIDSAAVPVFVLEQDASGRLIYVAFNRAARQVSGFPLEDVLGKTAQEVYPGRAGQIAYNWHVQAARSGVPLTYEVLLPFGESTRPIRTTLEPVMDDVGAITHLVGTSYDLSRDTFVSKLQANAEVLNSEIEEFVSIAAHDLRSPLTKIQGLAGLLKHGFQDLGDGKLEIINMLERVSIKSFELVAEVLSYTEVAKLGEEINHFALRELCSELMTVLDPDGRHSLVHDEVWLRADRTALQIVIRNLIDNAIKHCGCSHVEIHITLQDFDDGCLHITVRDNGRGFDGAAISFIESKRVATHSGFGLASIQRLIKTRGGALTIQQLEKGKGTAVKFTFPGEIQRAVA